MKKRQKIKRNTVLVTVLVSFTLIFFGVTSCYAQEQAKTDAVVFPVAAENPGWLGVGLREMTQDERTFHQVDHPGVMIKQIFNDTPAKKSGFKVGDYVVSVGNHPILKGVREMVAHVKANKEGARVSFTIKRDGKEQILTAILGKVPKRGEIMKNAWLNKNIPPISVMELDGKTKINLDQLQGKIVVIDYWATWCNPCKKAIPILEDLQEEYGDRDVMIIGVSDEEREIVQTYAKNRPVEYKIAYDIDRKLGGKLYISSYPTFLVIDKKGVIRSISTGLNGAGQLKSKIQKLIAE